MSKRVLVVEDQEDNMQIMDDMLSSAGYEVIKAVTGHIRADDGGEPSLNLPFGHGSPPLLGSRWREFTPRALRVSTQPGYTQIF